jgi:hypothetical protein
LLDVFKDSKEPDEQEMVRSILSGHPVAVAVQSLRSSSVIDDLLRFVVGNAASTDARGASKRADSLVSMFERWVRTRRMMKEVQGVLQFRTIIISVAMGIICAMLSTLAPLFASIHFLSGLSFSGAFGLNSTGTSTTTSILPTVISAAPGLTVYYGLLFVLPSSYALGAYFSPHRGYIGVVFALLSYSVVVSVFAPLIAGL